MKLLLTALLTSAAVGNAGVKVPYEATWQNPVNRNLYRIMLCETGGINNRRPKWNHWNSVYGGALGFRHSTWAQYKLPDFPSQSRYATPSQQYAVGRVLVRLYRYTPWPTCHVRLGIY